MTGTKETFRQKVLARLYGPPEDSESEGEYERSAASENSLERSEHRLVSNSNLNTNISTARQLRPTRDDFPRSDEGSLPTTHPPAQSGDDEEDGCQHFSVDFPSAQGQGHPDVCRSDSDPDSEDEPTEKRRRKRGKRGRASHPPSDPAIKEDQSPTGHLTLNHGGQLTKNQRRKLKKKRRAKERPLASGCVEGSEGGKEFVFKRSSLPAGRSDESKKAAEDVASIFEFLEGLLDVCKAKNPDSTPPPHLLEKLSETLHQDLPRTELSLFESTRQVLMLHSVARAREAVRVYGGSSTLSQDLKETLIALFNTWIEKVMDT